MHHKISVGFVIDGLPLPYNRVMASTRLRVYDIIHGFKNSSRYQVSLYHPFKKFDIVIFQKKFDYHALQIAKKLHRKNIKIVLDVNVNYYDKRFLKPDFLHQYADILEFTYLADAIITSSPYILEQVKKVFPHKRAACIVENIPDLFFTVRKDTASIAEPIKLVYSGYAVKAPEILLIKEQLEKVAQKYRLEYLFICEKDPEVKLPSAIPSRYIKYSQKNIPTLLAQGDIFLSPRNLDNPYNLGHSFTKIGSPMAVGLPVITSPVPSYQGSPALIVSDFGDEWTQALERLIKDREYYREVSEQGITYCREHFSSRKVCKEYEEFFDSLL